MMPSLQVDLIVILTKEQKADVVEDERVFELVVGTAHWAATPSLPLFSPSLSSASPLSGQLHHPYPHCPHHVYHPHHPHPHQQVGSYTNLILIVLAAVATVLILLVISVLALRYR